ncbi:Nucleotidyltransferase domain protein [compost metagenome]|jgi:predicted nucleotidyltransferase
MKREDAIVALRSLEPSLLSQGLAHLYLFGSVARNDAAPGSDVDVAFDVEPEFDLKFSLIDKSRIMGRLRRLLMPLST